MLEQDLRRLSFDTPGEGFTDLTGELNRQIGASGLAQGLATLLVLHTSCSLTINENADPRVLVDLSAFLWALVPQGGFPGPYCHDDEGPDDMPSHIRTALTTTSLALPFEQGRLVLGTWQAVYLWEHRARPQRRVLSLHLLGERSEALDPRLQALRQAERLNELVLRRRGAGLEPSDDTDVDLLIDRLHDLVDPSGA